MCWPLVSGERRGKDRRAKGSHFFRANFAKIFSKTLLLVSEPPGLRGFGRDIVGLIGETADAPLAAFRRAQARSQ